MLMTVRFIADIEFDIRGEFYNDCMGFEDENGYTTFEKLNSKQRAEVIESLEDYLRRLKTYNEELDKKS